MDTTLISIVIPYYNKTNTINRSVQSVLNQTYSNWELILIDDASDIPLSEIYKVEDNRIQVLSNEQNLGPGPTRQKGLDIAKGEFIAFLDADDWWDPCFFEFSLKYAQTKIAAIWSRTNLISDDGIRLKRFNEIEHKSIKKYLLEYGHPISTSSFLWTKIMLARWDNLLTQQDSMFELKTSLICDIIVPTNKVLVYQDKTGFEHREKYISESVNLKNKYIVYKELNNLIQLNFVEKLKIFQWFVRLYLKLKPSNINNSEEVLIEAKRVFFIKSTYVLLFINKVLSKTSLNIKF
jgi:glycosyltransferase involved in cell wall biosynthesis